MALRAGLSAELLERLRQCSVQEEGQPMMPQRRAGLSPNARWTGGTTPVAAAPPGGAMHPAAGVLRAIGGAHQEGAGPEAVWDAQRGTYYIPFVELRPKANSARAPPPRLLPPRRRASCAHPPPTPRCRWSLQVRGKCTIAIGRGLSDRDEIKEAVEEGGVSGATCVTLLGKEHNQALYSTSAQRPANFPITEHPPSSAGVADVGAGRPFVLAHAPRA
jgi:hypothetical protein